MAVFRCCAGRLRYVPQVPLCLFRHVLGGCVSLRFTACPLLLHFTLRHQRHRCAACCGACPLHIAPMQTQRYTPPHYRSIALPMKWIHFKLYVFRRHPCSVPFQTRTATKNRTQQTHPFLASDQYVTLQLL